jgi:hypothetical protein
MDEITTTIANPDTSSKILDFLSQFWSFLAVSLGVALGGVAAKRIVAVLVPAERQVAAVEAGGDKGGGPYRSAAEHRSAADIATDPKLPLWYRLWRASISIHPVVVGALTGLTPIPIASWVPDGSAAHMLWFGLAGAVSGQVFEIGKRVSEIIPALIRQKLGVRPSSPPPPAPAVAEPALAEKLEPEEPPKG